MSSNTSNSFPQIVIVGGGAGGLELAVKLGHQLGRAGSAKITLVDAAQTHLWKPLLHQVAAGTLDNHADEQEFIALAYRHDFSFRLGRMDGLDRANKCIHLAPVVDHEGVELVPRSVLKYDILVLALGSTGNDFGTPGAKEHAIMLDTPAAAMNFQRRLMNACIRAQVASQAEHSEASEPLNITIIGGGATGVELSAELHMTARIMGRYGLLDQKSRQQIQISVIDSASRLLPMLPERISTAVTDELDKLGVRVYTQEKVVEVSPKGVQLDSGKFIESKLVVWAAGIKAPDFFQDLDGLESNRINQLVVLPTLQTTRDPSIYALGDCAACPLENGKGTVPPRAQSAHQQASLVAKSIHCQLLRNPLPVFQYRDYGSLVSLGSYSTVGSLMGAIMGGSLLVEGMFAKLMYWSLHKMHQMAINGWLRTALMTVGELFARLNKPRIKLH